MAVIQHKAIIGVMKCSLKSFGATGLTVACTFFATAFLTATHAHALKFRPFVANFDSAGKGSTVSYLIENETDEPMAVQVSVTTREVTLDGQENNNPTKDFVVYPAQLILKPKSDQTVRIRWVGPANPPHEQAYRVIAEQLPIDLVKIHAGENEVKGAFKMLLRYVGAAYVSLKGQSIKQSIAMQSTEKITEGEHKGKLAMTLQNTGTVHTAIGEAVLTLSSKNKGKGKNKSKSVRIRTPDLGGVEGLNMLAGLTRRFVFPAPKGLPKGPWKAAFKYTPKEE